MIQAVTFLCPFVGGHQECLTCLTRFHPPSKKKVTLAQLPGSQWVFYTGYILIDRPRISSKVWAGIACHGMCRWLERNVCHNTCQWGSATNTQLDKFAKKRSKRSNLFFLRSRYASCELRLAWSTDQKMMGFSNMTECLAYLACGSPAAAPRCWPPPGPDVVSQ